MKTKITRLLDIKYPIIQASMAWIADAKLAGAVSEAGGLGVLGPNAGATAVTIDADEVGDRLREQIAKIRKITDKPFAVNFVVGVPGFDRQYSDRCVEVGIEEKVPVAVVSQGSPDLYTSRLKAAGMKVIQVGSAVKHAIKAEKAGVDAVIMSGTEGGGHSGFFQISTISLVPQAVDAVSIPVIAGGGLADGRGLAAALACGAEGVYMGTRFIATKECPAHVNVKKALLEAKDTSTYAVKHGSPEIQNEENAGDRGFVDERRGSVRMLINDSLEKIMAKHGGDITFQTIMDEQGSDAFEENKGNNATVACFIDGKINKYPATAGQGVGLVKDVPTCKELIERLITGEKMVLQRLIDIHS